MKIETTWRGMDELQRGLGAMPRTADREFNRAIRAGVNAARKEVRAAAPRKPRGPHQVSRGVRTKLKGRGGDTVGRVYLTGIAIPVATGTKPHSIAPKNRRVLKFGERFAAHVQHPGTRPNDFFSRGVNAATPTIEAELEKVGEDILNVITKTR